MRLDLHSIARWEIPLERRNRIIFSLTIRAQKEE
jgi:hypothetical protein